MSKSINWDEYYSKHCVRYYGWLPVCKALFQKKKKIKYLTLSDINAIDIFMLELEEVLKRDSNKVLTDIIICESELEKIQQIFENVRPPLQESIINGKIEQLLLFEDKPKYNRLQNDDPISRELRRTLNLRSEALRFQNEFPFDIINFDPCASILNPRKDTFKTVGKIVEFQRKNKADNYLLIITTPITKFLDAKNEFKKLAIDDYQSNLNNYSSIEEKSNELFGTINFEEIESSHKQNAIAFGKTIVAKLIKKLGLSAINHGIYIYENKDKRYMLSSVVEVITKPKNENWYQNEIVKIMEDMPTEFTYKGSLKNKEVVQHLQSIVNHREKIKEEFSK